MSRPYPVSTMKRAQELFEAGWKPTAIGKLLVEEGHQQPSRYTIQVWVLPGYRERQLAEKRRHSAKRSARTSRFCWPGSRSPEWKRRRMEVLRDAGLSMAAVAKVMSIDFPETPLTEHQVRGALAAGRTPRTWSAVA